MEISASYFQPLVGEEFIAREEGSPRVTRLVLREVTIDPVRQTALRVRKEPFRLYFHGPVENNVSGRIAWLSRDGTDSLILAHFDPKSLQDDVIEYEVIVG